MPEPAVHLEMIHGQVLNSPPVVSTVCVYYAKVELINGEIVLVKRDVTLLR